MKKKPATQPIEIINFKRADPEALAKFDPDTKRCTMNCGPHAQDPRTYEERKFLCDDCTTITAKPKMFDRKLNAALIMLDQIIEQIDTGFVKCDRCGEQEDTKDLDFADDIREVKRLITEHVA